MVIGFILISFLIFGLRKKIETWNNTIQNISDISLNKQQIISEGDIKLKENSLSVTNQKNRTLKIPYSNRFKVINEIVK
jgi:hypothetical protein